MKVVGCHEINLIILPTVEKGAGRIQKVLCPLGWVPAVRWNLDFSFCPACCTLLALRLLGIPERKIHCNSFPL